MRVCMGGERAYVYHQYKCGRRMKGNKNENDTINYKKIFLKTWTLVILKISDKVHLFWIHFAYPQNTATSRTVVVVWSLDHTRLFATPWTAACQAPLLMGFPRQE